MKKNLKKCKYEVEVSSGESISLSFKNAINLMFKTKKKLFWIAGECGNPYDYNKVLNHFITFYPFLKYFLKKEIEKTICDINWYEKNIN